MSGFSPPASELTPSSSTSTNPTNNKRRKRKDSIEISTDNAQSSSICLDAIGPEVTKEKPKKKVKKTPTPKVYSNILPHDFYDKLNIYGQHVFILSELERESNYLNGLHKKLSEHLHKLQIEESVMKKHFDALYRHQQEEEEQKQREDEYESENEIEEENELHQYDFPYTVQDFTMSGYGQPENIMSTEQIRYAPDLNHQQREDVVRNMKSSSISSTNGTEYEESKVPEVVSKEFVALRNYVVKNMKSSNISTTGIEQTED